MAHQVGSTLKLLSLLLILSAAKNVLVASLDRSSFPADFVFGTATSAYQIEGGASEGGKGPSIWDTFTQEHPDKIKDGSNGYVAVDSYHHFEEDIRLLNDLGVDAYRFSISWPRILPNGTLSGGINKEGVQYYNNIISKIKSYGIEPYVTIFHWDIPQALEDLYGGFLSPRIVEDFKNYAELCFKLFGDRVKHWMTVNEPRTFSFFAYGCGIHAPARCSPWELGKCSNGDSGREPYIVAHNQLLAHAAVVKLYRDKYKESDKGKIGITISCDWLLPYSESKSDREAVDRAFDFIIGWFMDPLAEGDYPLIMKSIVGDRLPKFTAEQSKMVKGSFDFLGVNYYSTSYVKSASIVTGSNVSCTTDSQTESTGKRDGIPIGPQAASDWIYIYPPGIREMLLHMKNKYNNPDLYITENGFDEVNNATLSLEESLDDAMRIDYFRDHLQFLQRATSEGVNVKGYFSWSLLDSFEWDSGYTIRFGLHYVDYKNMKRYPKKSALWFRKFLNKGGHASV